MKLLHWSIFLTLCVVVHTAGCATTGKANTGKRDAGTVDTAKVDTAKVDADTVDADNGDAPNKAAPVRMPPEARLSVEQRTQAAHQGDAEAQYILGLMHYYGEVGEAAVAEGGNEKAVAWMEKAANQGHAYALFALAQLHESGVGGLPENREKAQAYYAKAVALFQKAAKAGEAQAQYALGLLHAEGLGLPQNTAQAMELLTQAAQQGHSEAQRTLAHMCFNGQGESADINSEKGVEWLAKTPTRPAPYAPYGLGIYRRLADEVLTEEDVRGGIVSMPPWGDEEERRPSGEKKPLEQILQEAEAGEAHAQFQLGSMYYSKQEGGWGQENPHTTALAWLSRAIQQGHAEAQFLLGLMYLDGHGVPRNSREAQKWFSKAEKQGNPEIQAFLGILYAFWGDFYNYSGDDRALGLLLKASKQGHAEASFVLAKMHERGAGVFEDYRQAVAWYEKAASQGHRAAHRKLGEVQARLGEKYLYGESMPENAHKAFEWFSKAAERGHAMSLYSLGDMYAEGKGVEKDMSKAMGCYEKAAEQKDNVFVQALAWRALGDIYAEGKGVAKALPKAIELYEKAAKAEEAEADVRLKLGLLYLQLCLQGDGRDEHLEKGCGLATYADFSERKWILKKEEIELYELFCL